MQEERVSMSALVERLATAKQQMPVGSKWQHYKGGKYIILDFVIFEASMEVGVVYGPLDTPGVKFVRPLVVWQDMIEWQGAKVFRFQSLGG